MAQPMSLDADGRGIEGEPPVRISRSSNGDDFQRDAIVEDGNERKGKNGQTLTGEGKDAEMKQTQNKTGNVLGEQPKKDSALKTLWVKIGLDMGTALMMFK